MLISPAKTRVEIADALGNRGIVRTDGTCIVKEFIDHIAGNDALGRVGKMNRAIFRKQRTDLLVDGTGETVDSMTRIAPSCAAPSTLFVAEMTALRSTFSSL